jgi:type VI secretion system protein ImpB
MAGSIQKKLERIRPPKVQISYDVETYDAIEKKELPFMVGILADLGGDNRPTDARGRPQKITDRTFMNVDRDNFDEVLGSCRPRVSCRVPDRLTGEPGRNMTIDIEFGNLADFHPEKVAEKVEPLRKLMDVRRRLASLKQKMDGNDDLEEQLNEILADAEERRKLLASLGTGDDAGGQGPAAE